MAVDGLPTSYSFASSILDSLRKDDAINLYLYLSFFLSSVFDVAYDALIVFKFYIH